LKQRTEAPNFVPAASEWKCPRKQIAIRRGVWRHIASNAALVFDISIAFRRPKQKQNSPALLAAVPRPPRERLPLIFEWRALRQRSST
jgi:hypothetical protein